MTDLVTAVKTIILVIIIIRDMSTILYLVALLYPALSPYSDHRPQHLRQVTQVFCKQYRDTYRVSVSSNATETAGQSGVGVAKSKWKLACVIICNII